MLRRNTQRLSALRSEIATQLVSAAESGGWQRVMDMVRRGFQVERATLYTIQDGKIEHGWTSAYNLEKTPIGIRGSVEPFGMLRSVIYLNRQVLIPEPDHYLLDQWPSRKGVRTLFAAPVRSGQSDVRGILELVNRVLDHDHPYELFDADERAAAVDVALSLATAMDPREPEELRAQLVAAQMIGAVGLNSAFAMHRLMTYYAKIGNTIDWLRLHPECSKEERSQCLEEVRRHCSEAVVSVSRVASVHALEKRSERVDILVAEAVRAVESEFADRAQLMQVDNNLCVAVYVNVYSVIQALVNLFKNAFDAVQKSGRIEVSSGLSECEKLALIRIYNTGPLLTLQEIEAFLKVGYTSKKAQGNLGLGLKIARRAIEASGGRITFAPSPNGGLLVLVELPLAQDSASPGS